tara:strand:+ start:1723 stop:2706 length:984 start_codon:yes stop_codon:yes gene_type:complete
MIIKSFEINKINFFKTNFFLFYGENEGLKNEIINKNFKDKYQNNTFRYEEKEILNEKDSFVESILTKSFFEKEKLIIISRTSDKIIDIVREIFDKNLQDIKFILLSGVLEKKSKLRIFFEKDKNAVCIPFYSDTNQTLSYIASAFFKENKILVSQETINFIIERCRGSRQSLNNELNKIKNYSKNKEKITSDEILKLTNLSENYNFSELADNCLAKNLKKTVNILNENNFSIEDSIIIIRTFLAKAKRLMKLQEEIQKSNNVDEAISNYRPPVFWKEKEILKKQITHWPSKKVENLIEKISETELLIKKNSSNSINILSDFIITQSN